MAKKYYSHEELKTALVNAQECRFTYDETNGTYKPMGTLGKHHLTLMFLPDDFILVEGYNTYGDRTGCVIVTPRHNLGYDCGDVWRVLDAQHITDPLKKAMVTYKLGNDRVKWVKPGHRIGLYDVAYSAGPQYVTFVNAERVGHTTEFGLATWKRIFQQPIDQLDRVGDFYILVGTPRHKVAEFITKVMTADQPHGSTSTPHPFETYVYDERVDINW